MMSVHVVTLNYVSHNTVGDTHPQLCWELSDILLAMNGDVQ